MQIKMKMKADKRWVILVESHDPKEYKSLLEMIVLHNKLRQDRHRQS